MSCCVGKRDVNAGGEKALVGVVVAAMSKTRARKLTARERETEQVALILLALLEVEGDVML